MLVCIDESGDPGFKLNRGSSRYFVVSLVVFEENEDAVACSQRIDLLRNEMNWSGEFHFYRNSDSARRKFIEAIAPYNFFYYGIVIDKTQITPNMFPDKYSFYKYACGLVFENAKDKLQNATVVIDRSGGMAFRRELAKYLKRQLNRNGDLIIKKVKLQRSDENNLLQLADYIAGILNRHVQGKKKFATDYHKIIGHREIKVDVWPH